MEGREQTGRVNHALAERINQYILEQKSSIAAISKEIGYSRTPSPSGNHCSAAVIPSPSGSICFHLFPFPSLLFVKIAAKSRLEATVSNRFKAAPCRQVQFWTISG